MENNKYPKRKAMRLQKYDYSLPGAFFVTICTKDKAKIFWLPVGRDDLGAPHTLSRYGRIVEKFIASIPEAYPGVTAEKYVIMPNHVHMIVSISHERKDGAPGSSRPTLSQVIGAMKRLSNKDEGIKLWQTSFYEHIIRSEDDYRAIWQYIETNPARWEYDEYC